MGGVEVRPWSLAAWASDIGKGSVSGLSPCRRGVCGSGVGTADTELERGWGKVAQGVEGVDWMVEGRARGDGL